MWSVNLPHFDMEETFRTCISRVKDRVLKAKLTAITQDIIDAADDYIAHAEDGDLHLIAKHDMIGGTVTKDEMVAVYNGGLVRKEGPGRSIYTAIKLLPEHDRCPFCDHRDVSTLDHVLPKALFPIFAVTPDNLVGSCKDCNKAKRSTAPTCAADTVLHPYFDDVSSRTWLTASVVEQEVCAVLFNVQPQDDWTDDLKPSCVGHDALP